MKVNLNYEAKCLTEMEGGVRNLPIAQIKEVLRCLGRRLGASSPAEAFAVMAKLIEVAEK